MTQDTRRWRFLGLMGVSLCITSGVVYAISVVLDFERRFQSGAILEFVAGCVKLEWPAPGRTATRNKAECGWFLSEPWESYSGPPSLWFHFEINSRTRPLVGVPLWVPLLVFALPTAYAFYRYRPCPPGHCPTCGYNLAGLTTSVCPECGKPVEPTGGAP